MADDRGRYINEIVEHPAFERIRGEILNNVETRAKEAQAAFNGLMTFCGVIYTGGTIAVLGFVGGRISAGVPYLAIASLGLFVCALLSFAILYQRHSQLMAGRHHHYAMTANAFFGRKATLEEVLAAGHAGQAKYLYRAIFWVPLALASAGFICGGLGVLGLGSISPPVLPLITP
ncbi:MULTISPECIES: hypothetical protein [unclassified Mesorhizobium]|uniref:hypothetical protein n=1 Tax=unclassified Mesorhizobium TaxID=325217 RepID=UPI0011291C52|nr:MULTISPECIES: hypothetical protein [unclassified Mesorhizobium]TPK42645.1 hypothetical protein FJ550_29765 [Mesorhizobium sp. B2-5-2]TPL26765.1 hypothetical protein FJ946_13085 [Mesorhizobium sp. B2-4-7]TPL40543.1 hypothetical protein FJ961_17385 [Mesorhizobium sp. B2-4-5]TPM76817.1 hypothetical protein FJ968_03615 [Mesorhizobium sp. B2-1-6]TPN72480.1 hypothetical protein FJ985_29270 [Mesorhizobium sp. B1-1-2]